MKENNYIDCVLDLYENDDNTYYFYIKLFYEKDKDTVEYKMPINMTTTIDNILNFDGSYLVAGNDFNNNAKKEIKDAILEDNGWIEYINNCLEKAKK